MNINFLKIITVVGASILFSIQAVAGFDITRMTTIVDDLSGSYTVTKSGRLTESQFTGTSLTEFNQFHPGHGENENTISGLISKQISRGDGQLNTRSDGSLVLESKDGVWEVSFNGLDVQVNESGIELAGSVVVNEETYDAAELPEGVARVLRRVFWLTRR